MTKTKIITFSVIAIAVTVLLVNQIMHRTLANTNKTVANDTTLVRGFVAQLEPYIRRTEGSGTLMGDKESLVAAETGGRVMEIRVEVGDIVRAGQPLVRLDDELYRLESERAKIAYDKANMDFKRMEKLYQEKSVSETDFEGAKLMQKGAEVQYEMARKTYCDATICAPFTGTVAAKMTEVGQMAERGMPVVHLVDISTLKLTMEVSEQDIRHIRAGDAAQLYIEALEDTVQGKVTAVGSRAANGTRAFPVDIQIKGDGRIRSGMFARAFVVASNPEEGVLLPRSAVLPDMGLTIVFRAKNGIAEKMVVGILGLSGEKVVVSGLMAGDSVITTGNQALAHGSKINLLLEDRSAQ